MATDHLSDEQLSTLVDGAQTAEEEAMAAGHVSTCESCSGRLELLRATSHAVASLPDEELPRPLDLGFLRDERLHDDRLHDAQPAAADTPRGFVARVIHGRPPVWLPATVAAAAVLVVAVTVGPGFLRAGGRASQATSGPLALGGQASPSQPALGLLDKNGAAGAAPAQGGAVPNVAPEQGLSQVAQKTVTGPDGSRVTIVVNPSSASTGQPTQLLLKVIGGPSGTNLALQGIDLVAGQGSTQFRIAGDVGNNAPIPAGNEVDLTAEWSAGAVAGPPRPGAYTLIGRVFLAGGQMIEVTLPFTVSG